jgi:GNAT superfamily N-acetyltransferase
MDAKELPLRSKVVETIAELSAVVSLRYEVLRKEWKQPFSTATDAIEQNKDTLTIAIFHPENEEALATARLQPYNKPNWAQVRFVAVQKEWQHKGLGSLIMTDMHYQAKERGYTHIYLEARELALPLYIKLDYEVKGFLDMRLGLIPHYACEKYLIT